MKRYITQLFIDTELSLPNLKKEIFEKIESKNISIERYQLKKMPKYKENEYKELNVYSFVASSTKKLSTLKNLFNKIGHVSWFVITSDNDYKHSKHPQLKPF